MRDLSFCQRPLSPASRGIEAHDPRFLQIVDLAQRSQFQAAADRIDALHAEETYDARLAGYFLYAAFEEGGGARLAELFEALQALLTKSWEPLLPPAKAPAHLNRSASWFLQTLLHAVEYHRANKGPTWEGWVKGLTPEGLDGAIDRAQALAQALPEPAFHQTIELLGRTLRWLRELQGSLAARPTEAQPETPSAASPAATPEARVGDGTFTTLGQPLQLRGSARLVELLNKLKAFELLVEKRAFQRAALVGDDVLTALDSFDPRDYFPELFASFGALLNQHVGEITPHWQQKDSVEWKALAQFYQVDLEHFVEE